MSQSAADVCVARCAVEESSFEEDDIRVSACEGENIEDGDDVAGIADDESSDDDDEMASSEFGECDCSGDGGDDSTFSSGGNGASGVRAI